MKITNIGGDIRNVNNFLLHEEEFSRILCAPAELKCII